MAYLLVDLSGPSRSGMAALINPMLCRVHRHPRDGKTEAELPDKTLYTTARGGLCFLQITKSRDLTGVTMMSNYRSARGDFLMSEVANN